MWVPICFLFKKVGLRHYLDKQCMMSFFLNHVPWTPVLNVHLMELRYLLVGKTSLWERFWWARKWLWFHLSVNNHIHTIVIHSHGLNIKPWRGFAIFSLICIPLEAQVHMCLSVCCSRLDIYTSYLHFANIPMTTCFHLVRHQIDRKKIEKLSRTGHPLLPQV